MDKPFESKQKITLVFCLVWQHAVPSSPFHVMLFRYIPMLFRHDNDWLVYKQDTAEKTEDKN